MSKQVVNVPEQGDQKKLEPITIQVPVSKVEVIQKLISSPKPQQIKQMPEPDTW